MKIRKKKKKPVLRRARKASESGTESRWQKIYRPVFKRWKTIAIVGGVIALSGAAVGGYFWYRHDRELRAARAYAHVRERIADVVKEAVEEAGEEGKIDEEKITAGTIKELEALIERFGDTAVGRAATYELASLYFDQGRFDEAQERFEEVRKKSSGLEEVLAAEGVADCHKARGEYEDAAIKYRVIFEGHKGEFPCVPVAINLAECYRETDQTEEAVKLYRYVVDYHRLSPYAEVAENELKKAEAISEARK